MAFQRHTAAFQNLRKLRIELEAQELDDRRPRQQVQHRTSLRLGMIQRRHVDLRQQRLQVRHFDPLLRPWAGGWPDDVSQAVVRFGGQQSLHISVAYQGTRDMQAHLLYELGAQVNVVAQVVNPNLQTFQRERRNKARQ